MAKNIVLCLDGTGNQIEENISNVLKMFRVLRHTKKQTVYYDQGIGTLGREDTWGRIKQWLVSQVLAMGFGIGMDTNVIRAYEFLVKTYEPDDKIYLFGFSRGAHTARVLAGMLYEIGLLKPDQINLSGAALTAYKQSKPKPAHNDVVEDDYEGEGANFRRVSKPHTVAIEFMGVWDTVSSVLVPNYKELFIPPIKPENLLHTHNNPAVRSFRQAASVDEGRRCFRLDAWDPDQKFKPNYYSQGDPPDQSAEQIWFAGVHSDVGGGYPRLDSGLSQFSFIWMIEQAKTAGLDINNRMARYVAGVEKWSEKTDYIYPPADVQATKHNSIRGLWWILEFIPKRVSRREFPDRRSLFGLYIPRGEPRFIPEDANIHPSVYERIKAVKDYNTVNIK